MTILSSSTDSSGSWSFLGTPASSPPASPPSKHSLKPIFENEVEIYSLGDHHHSDKIKVQRDKISPLTIKDETSPRSLLRKKNRHSLSQKAEAEKTVHFIKGGSDSDNSTANLSNEGAIPVAKKESPPSRRKGSDPEERRLLTADRRPQSMLDLLHRPHGKPTYEKDADPYENLKLVVHETTKTAKPLAYKLPYQLLATLNQMGMLGKKVIFCYPKVIIENERKRSVVKVADLIDDVKVGENKDTNKGKLFSAFYETLSEKYRIECDDCDKDTQRIVLEVKSEHAGEEEKDDHTFRLSFKTSDFRRDIKRQRTNEEFLTKIIRKIYSAGYLENPPEEDKIKKQIEMIYHSTSLLSVTQDLPPEVNFSFMNAHVPAYLLLNQMTPSALKTTKYALALIFPVLFPGSHHIENVKSETIEDGQPRFYFETSPIGQLKQNNDYVKIKVLGTGEAEVIHKVHYNIMANIVTRLETYPNKPEEPKCEKYQTLQTKVILGDLSIDYILRPLSTSPLFSIEIVPSKIKQYGKKALDQDLKKFSHITETFELARNELKASLQKQLKPKKYLLDDNSTLHCEEIKT